MIIDIEPDELAMDIPHDTKLEIIDVRKPGEFNTAHVKGAVNVPVDTLIDPVTIAQINEDNNLYIQCAGGYRSVIAASLLKRQGYHNLRNVLGGFAKIKGVKNIPIVTPQEQKV
jgi:rhodanese-related sulfurtransferase